MKSWNQYTEAWLQNITNKLKKKRVDLFIKTLQLDENAQILDLGSEDGSYLSKYYPWPQNIIIADINEEPMKRGVEKFNLKGYKLISPDGVLPFKDGDFDAVWCNSVIEHVTLDKVTLGDVNNSDFVGQSDVHQRNFAREIERVAKKYFVQTPYVHFPIEAHSWMPFIQYLPQPLRWKFCKWFKNIWVKQWTADFYLYDKKRFLSHFEKSTGLIFEKAIALRKSMFVYRC